MDEFEVGYDNSDSETEIIAWKDKTIKKATVIHKGSDGYLTVEFSDGVIKKYGYNDLGFWENKG